MSEEPQLAARLEEVSAFEGFTAEEREAVSSAAELVVLGPGEVLIREGDVSDRLFLLLEGRVRVTKRVGGEEFTITEIGPGELLGEIAAFDRQPRSATAVATDRVEAAVFAVDALRRQPELRPAHAALHGLALYGATRRLRTTSEAMVDALRKELELSRERIGMGVFMVNILTLVSLYTLSLRGVAGFTHPVYGARLISVLGLLLFGAVTLFTMHQSGFPLSTYGLRLAGWRRHTLEAVVWTIPFLALLTALKWVGILALPQLRDEPLFNPFRPFMRDGELRVDFLLMALFVYVLLCPVQELFARGGCQTSLYRFLTGSERRRVWTSNVVANLLFAMGHSHVSFKFAMAAFVPGLLWGWVYSRQGTLVGATVSHVLLGSWLLFVLGTGGVL